MGNPKQRAASDARGHERSGSFARVATNSAATMEELRDFLGQMKGRNPQEVLGLVAESGLAKGVLTAAAWTVVLIAIFTVGPYTYSQIWPELKVT
jgi:hypothetical protein